MKYVLNLEINILMIFKLHI